MRVGKISALLNPATYVIVNLAIIAIIWFGGLQVDSGRLTQGEITALVSYMTQIMLALIVIANLVVIFTKASACGTRVSEGVGACSNGNRSRRRACVYPGQRGHAEGIVPKRILFLWRRAGKCVGTD